MNTQSDYNKAALKSANMISNYFKKRNAEINFNEMNSMERSFEVFQEGFERRVIESLDKEQISEFKKAFENFDQDGDGTMQTKELRTAMRSLGQNPTDRELQDMINEIDINGNGTIDFIEFLYMMVQMLTQADVDEEIYSAFQVFDDFSCGSIDMKEFKEVLHSVDETLTEKEGREIMKRAGIIQGNRMNYDQFSRLMSW